MSEERRFDISMVLPSMDKALGEAIFHAHKVWPNRVGEVRFLSVVAKDVWIKGELKYGFSYEFKAVLT